MYSIRGAGGEASFPERKKVGKEATKTEEVGSKSLPKPISSKPLERNRVSVSTDKALPAASVLRQGEREKRAALTHPMGLQIYQRKKSEPDRFTWLCSHSMYDAEDPSRTSAVDKVARRKAFTSVAEERAYGALIGLAVGDAVGAPFEFSAYSPKNREREFSGFENRGEWSAENSKRDHNRFKLKPGQWTDDTSMALCLADSLIEQEEFDPLDLKTKFLCWSAFGYNNAFGHDPEVPQGRPSIGLGGTISHSFAEFAMQGEAFPYTQMGTRESSGNGSIMRLSPVALKYHGDTKAACEVAYMQSKTTHQGEEAAECSRLLAHILTRAIQGEERGDTAKKKLLSLVQGFSSPLHSVTALSRSTTERKEHLALSKKEAADRDWNWMDENFTFADSRVKANAGYAGSYAMDCLAMSLHCVATTESFEEAVLKAARQGGDADTVAAVTGQIAGALYGCGSIPKSWSEEVLKWDGHNDIPLRAHKLFHGERV